MKILRANYVKRNPYQISSLPWIGKLYRFRCGSPKGLSTAKKILRKLIPNRPFFSSFFKLFASGKKGFMNYSLGENSKKISFNLKNTQFHSVYFKEYEDGYEPETGALMDLFIEDFPMACCLDVGSNWGHFSLHMASHPKFDGVIHAFEPMENVFLDLKKVVKEAGLENKVHCYNMALSNESGTGLMVLPDGFNTGKAMLTRKSVGVSVKLEKLDNLDHLEPDFIKVDAEGAEGIIFEGAKEKITKTRPMIFFENWSDLNKPEETLHPLKVLEELGYHFFEPTFLFHKNGYDYLLGYGDKDVGKVEGKIQLVELPLLGRFLYKKQLNIFACHESKLDWLESRFEKIH